MEEKTKEPVANNQQYMQNGIEQFEKKYWAEAIKHFSQVTVGSNEYDSALGYILKCSAEIEKKLLAVSKGTGAHPKHTWKEKFLDHLKENMPHYCGFAIDESVLYIYLNEFHMVFPIIARESLLHFQRALSLNTFRTYATALTIFNNRKILQLSANDHGLVPSGLAT